MEAVAAAAVAMAVAVGVVVDAEVCDFPHISIVLLLTSSTGYSGGNTAPIRNNRW